RGPKSESKHSRSAQQSGILSAETKPGELRQLVAALQHGAQVESEVSSSLRIPRSTLCRDGSKGGCRKRSGNLETARSEVGKRSANRDQGWKRHGLLSGVNREAKGFRPGGIRWSQPRTLLPGPLPERFRPGGNV